MKIHTSLFFFSTPLNSIHWATATVCPSTHISAPLPLLSSICLCTLPDASITLWAYLHFLLVTRALFFWSPSSDEKLSWTPLFLHSSHCSYSVSQGSCLSIYLYHLFPHLTYFWNLMMETVFSSAKSVNIYQTTWHHTPDDTTVCNNCHEKKPRICATSCTWQLTRNTVVLISILNENWSIHCWWRWSDCLLISRASSVVGHTRIVEQGSIFWHYWLDHR